MARGGGSGIGTLIGLGIAGIGVWWAGNTFGWWGGASTSAAAAAPASPSAPTGTTGGVIPAGTPMPTTPAASVQLAGPVTATLNNALQANFNINGQIQNIAVIPGGDAYDSSGHGITAQLAAIGVTPQQLYSLMSAAYTAPVTTTSAPATTTTSTATPSVGNLAFRKPATRPVTTLRGLGGVNYVRRGTGFGMGSIVWGTRS